MNEKLITKYDKACFKLVKRLILSRVRKNKFKQNKYFIFARMYDLYLAVYVISCFVILPVGLFLTHTHFATVALITAFWILIAFDRFNKKHSIIAKAHQYDIVFQNRKNPIIYQGIKDMLKNQFKSDMEYRAVIIPFHFLSQALGILFVSSFIFYPNFTGVIWLPFFVHEFFIEYIDRYIFYVFDFDPPDQRKKKRESLTELMRRVIEGFLREPLLGPSMGIYSPKLLKKHYADSLSKN